MARKKVLIVSPTKIGLTETFIQAHIDRLDADTVYLYGWDLEFKNVQGQSLYELYSPKRGGMEKLQSLLPHAIYFRLEEAKKKNYTHESLIKRFIREEGIDLILAEYGTAGSFIAPICKDLNLPLIVHFHGIDASKYQTIKFFKEGYQRMFQYASHVVGVSKHMVKALERLGCPPEKLILNTYGPHADYKGITPDYDSDYLISVGRHTYKKAPYLTILAFQKVLQKHPHLKLKMIGDGELFDVSQNMVKSLGLDKNITLLGALERGEILKHMRNAFLFVQHSIVAYNGDSEGTPVGIIEAMAAGLPVVSTRHAGIPDVVLEGETGLLVDENDLDSMVANMIQVIENRFLAKEMGQAGKKQILENYTMEKHINRLNELINA